MNESWVRIGRVASVEAARRVIRVTVAAGCEREFDDRERIWVQAGQSSPVQARIHTCRDVGAMKVIALSPGISRDVVAEFKGALLLIPTAARRPRADATCALTILVDMSVETVGGQPVGRVFETMDTPAGGIIRLHRPGGGTAALPVTDALIVRIDTEAGVVVVNDPTPFLVE